MTNSFHTFTFFAGFRVWEQTDIFLTYENYTFCHVPRDCRHGNAITGLFWSVASYIWARGGPSLLSKGTPWGLSYTQDNTRGSESRGGELGPSVQRLQNLKPEPICQWRRKHSLSPANQRKNGAIPHKMGVQADHTVPPIPPLHLLLPVPKPIFLPTAARVASPTRPSAAVSHHVKASVLAPLREWSWDKGQMTNVVYRVPLDLLSSPPSSSLLCFLFLPSPLRTSHHQGFLPFLEGENALPCSHFLFLIFPLFIFYFKLIFIGVCSVELVSTVQQSESAVRIHIVPPLWISFPFRSPQSIE